MSTVLWFIAAGLLAAAELATFTYVLGLLAVAALVAGVASLVIGSVTAQLLVASGASAGLLVGVLPVARRHRQVPPTASGTAALVGAEAVALTAVDARSGQVRLAGEVWSARSAVPHVSIQPGQSVSVLSIEGATAVVHPLEL